MNAEKSHVIVAGAGYGGLMAAIRLARKAQAKKLPIEITLVNASDYFVERIRLHQVAAAEHVKHHPIQRFLRGTGVSFVAGQIVALDPTKKRLNVLTMEGMQSLAYDTLIYALGSRTDRESVPGVAAHTFTLDSESTPKLTENLANVARN